jgi:hypothetical protein
MLLGPNSFADVEIEADASTTNREASLAVRVRDVRNFYLFIFIPDGVPVMQGRSGGLWLYKAVDGEGSFLGNTRLPGFVQAGDTVRMSLTAQGSTLIAKMNGREVLRADDVTHPGGRVGLRIFGAQDSPCDSTFANVRVTPS